MENAVSTSTAF